MSISIKCRTGHKKITELPQLKHLTLLINQYLQVELLEDQIIPKGKYD